MHQNQCANYPRKVQNRAIDEQISCQSPAGRNPAQSLLYISAAYRPVAFHCILDRGSPIVVHKFPLYARLAEIQPIRYYDTKRTFTPVGAVDEGGVEWPSKGDIE